MNIKEAKEQIKYAMTAYFTKDAFGKYVIPPETQRPVFLMGPPGIGKTAIMEQIASELGVGLVSYSMTHHTRQSALGLPYIEKKNYGGREYTVSEYTMSEIIASVYDLMEESGLQEGILFLDEINCVSETLAPAMLQFLQYKTFGRHRVPAGWIVVTAGNPPEYNSSVRNFDIVTWDRLKRIDVEPDYGVWKEYAHIRGVHPAVTTYLDIRRDDFYHVETTVDGRSFVTARGWTDLSDMIKLYERHGMPVDEKLIGQYLQDPRVAGEFGVYYSLFSKYKSDYQIDQILAGKASAEVRERAKAARFDERLALLGLLLDGVTDRLRGICRMEQSLNELMGVVKNIRIDLARPGAQAAQAIQKQIDGIEKRIEAGQLASSLSADSVYACRMAIDLLERQRAQLAVEGGGAAEAIKLLKSAFDAQVAALKADAILAGDQLSHLFAYCADVFGDGQEMVVLVNELTISYYGMHFISRYGCAPYFEYSKKLLFREQQREILGALDRLEIDWDQDPGI